MPRTPSAPRPRWPATQRPQRTRRMCPGRPRGLAVQPSRGPSPRGWPPWPPCWPDPERAPHTPWPRHTQETWLLQSTQRRC